MGRSIAPLGVTSVCHYLEAGTVLPEVDVGGSIPPGLPFYSLIAEQEPRVVESPIGEGSPYLRESWRFGFESQYI